MPQRSLLALCTLMCTSTGLTTPAPRTTTTEHIDVWDTTHAHV